MANEKWKMHFFLPLPSAHCLVISFALPKCLFQGSWVSPRNRNVRSTPMPISQDLLEILACPACKAKVELKPDGSALKCVECRRVYPIRDDIPVMLVDEAKIEDEIESGTEDRAPEQS
jgi:uncharacterized protein YbaR (Trm112 family)